MGATTHLGKALGDLRSLGSAASGQSWSQRVSAVAPVAATRRWTAEQDAVLSCSEDRIEVLALAGTGKTELLAAYAAARPKARWRYAVFNRSMADDARKRLPSSVVVSTIHAACFGRFGRPLAHKLDRPWTPDLLKRCGVRPMSKALQPAAVELLRTTLARFIASSDAELSVLHLQPAEWACWQSLDAAGQVWASPEAVISTAAVLWRLMLDPESPAPVFHDVWVKLAQLARASWSDDGWLVDEAQDLTPAAADWLALQPARQIRVGDPHQAIYAWKNREQLPAWAAAARFGLTISFRCGPTLANVANRVLARIGEPMRLVGAASDGVVSGEPEAGQPGVALLCRSQAGAIAAARVAHAAGWSLSSLPRVPTRWQSVAALRRGDRSAILDPWVQGFDTYEAWCAAMARWPDADWRRARRWAEGESPPPLAGAGLTVSTIHQAKGLAFDAVWLGPDIRLPSGPASKWSIEQREEARLAYVAVTRARMALHQSPAIAARWEAWLGNRETGWSDDGF